MKGLLRSKLDAITSALTKPVICVAHGYDIDKIAEEWSFSRWYTVAKFRERPKYKNDSRIMLNKEMIEYACERRPAFCVVVWNGKSRECRDMIERCRKNKVKLRIINYKSEESDDGDIQEAPPRYFEKRRRAAERRKNAE